MTSTKQDGAELCDGRFGTGAWPELTLADGADSRPKEHSLDLVLDQDSSLVRLSGDIDVVAAGDVDRLMRSLDQMTTVVIRVDLGDVQFIDSSGLQPLIEATRRRRARGLPPVLIARASRPALCLLRAAGLTADPVLDVDAWDRLAAAGSEAARRLLAGGGG